MKDKPAEPKISLEDLLTKGDVASGHRSKAKAEKLLPQVLQAFGLQKGGEVSNGLENELVSFIVDVILGASWYSRKYQTAYRKALAYIALNAVLVIAIPLGVAFLGTLWSATSTAQQYSLLIAQLSSVLTGVLALQKTLSAWYSQQQNYAGWYKCGADLKEIYYALLKKWAGHIPGREIEFAQDLQDAEESARHVMKAERIEYYTRLALPSFDVLDMLTASKTNVTNLVTSIVPAAKKASTIAIGTKAILGAQGQSESSTDLKEGAPTGSDAEAGSGEIITDNTQLESDQQLVQKISLKVISKFPSFDQDVVDYCASTSISNSADIAAALGGHKGFFDWFNVTFAHVPAVQARYPSSDTQIKRDRFERFWDQVDVIFEKPKITAIEFCALMAVNLEESSGNLSSAPEGMNKMKGPHPGLAYAFDRIPEKKKQSYNHKPNRTALSLFEDPLFVNAHKGRAGADKILKRPGGIDPRWGGETWPGDVPAFVDADKNGFIMESDFYKFRGRGVIQTTWRSDYKLMIEWILSLKGNENQTLAEIAARWGASVPKGPPDDVLVDAIATVSSNEDWDQAFGEAITLAKGVAIDSAAKNNYLNSLSNSAATLNGPKNQRGSLLYFAAHINGGDYPARVQPIMKALMCGLAETNGTVAVAREPRAPQIVGGFEVLEA